LDIEEAQDKNVFGDIQDLLEYNYLEIEEKVQLAKEYHLQLTSGVEDPENQQPFNHLGVDNLVNLHEHINQMVQKREFQ